MTPLISVIVPIYKVEPYLGRCVDSLLSQTYPHLEILLVDDGSPDRCGEMCDQYAAKDSRVKVIHKENGGLSDARNAGMAAANGELFGFVDSDDWVAPDFYEALWQAMEREDADVSCCGRYLVYGDRKVPRFTLPEPKVFEGGEAAVSAILLDDVLDSAAWDKLFRRELWEGLSFPVGKLSEDVAVMYRVFDRARRVAHIGVPAYFYRQRPGSITGSAVRRNHLDVLEHCRAIRAFVGERYPSLSEQAEAMYYKNVKGLMARCQLTGGKGCEPEALAAVRSEFQKNYRGAMRSACLPRKDKALFLSMRLHVYPLLYRLLKQGHAE